MNRFQDSPWYNALTTRGSVKTYAADDAIAFQGEPSEMVGLVLSGRAKAVSYSEEGEQTWLGHFNAGEFFGHTSFLTQMPVNFEITADGEMSALILPVSALPDLLKSQPELGHAFAKDLAVRLDNMMRRLVEALTLSAKGRVCAELVRLASPIGIDPGKDIIRPNPVFVDLALRVNSTRETVSRTVSELQKKGVISREPGALLVQNRDALRAAVK